MRRKIQNLNLKLVTHLTDVLNESLEKIVFVEPNEFLNKIHKCKKTITVHLYNEIPKKNKKTILNFFPGTNQVYFSTDTKNIFSTVTNQNSSQSRFNHNFLIDKITNSKELMEKTPTMIVKFIRSFPVAYFFYDAYSYINHGIDSNYHKDLFKKIGLLKIPFSEYSGESLNQNGKIIFNDYKKKIEVYKTLNKDALSNLLER